MSYDQITIRSRVTFSMTNNTRKSSRKPARKITYSSTAKGLTSQAGVIPVIHFLQRLGLEDVCDKHIDFKRGANARYSLSHCIFLSVIGMIAGANSLLKVVAIWSDEVLRQVSGLTMIPDDSVLGRIFRRGTFMHVTQLESVNHTLRNRIWQKAMKSG